MAFTTDEIQRIRLAIRKKYAAVASSAAGHFKYLVGRKGAQAPGYDILEETPDEVLSSFCGVGNLFAIERITAGSFVLDIGCGAGFDLWVASRLTGENGRVFGVDLTDEMVARARSNRDALRMKNVEIDRVDSENLPFAGNSFDVVISNGVINLSPDKQRLFAEINRVLRPGGRL